MHFQYKTWGTCSSEIAFDLDGEVVTNIQFRGGCNGNLKAIAKLVNGWTVDQIRGALAGNACGPRPTSCADQLAQAVSQARQKLAANQ